MSKVATIDFSIRQTGICIGDTKKPYFDNCLFYYCGQTKYANCLPMKWCLKTDGLLLDRCEKLTQCVVRVLGKHNIRNVYIESIAYRANNFQFSQAVATQYITDRLQQLGFTVEVINIGTIKKAFTGKGRATKAEMRQHFKNVGLKLPVALGYQADLVDAYAIFHTVTKETNKGEHIFTDKRRKQ